MPDNNIVEAPIMLAFQHWQRIGFSVQTSMILALAYYCTDDGILIESRKYMERHTNVRLSDLV